jgi:hypothetical protein
MPFSAVAACCRAARPLGNQLSDFFLRDRIRRRFPPYLVKGIKPPFRHRKGEDKMENETKNKKANIGEARPKFQQAEPAELDEADLLSVAGGAIPKTGDKSTGCMTYEC